MLNYVMIGFNDIDKMRRFYNTDLGALGAGAPTECTTNNTPLN